MIYSLRMKNALLLILALIPLSACTPTQVTRGNIVEDDRISEIVPGISTRQNVLTTLGSPTTVAPFDDNVWYYIGQKTEQRGVFDPEVKEQKVVVVSFNQDGVVEQIAPVDAQGLEIPIARRKTPTSGNDITVMQQLLGNIGKFNKPAESPAR